MIYSESTGGFVYKYHTFWMQEYLIPQKKTLVFLSYPAHEIYCTCASSTVVYLSQHLSSGWKQKWNGIYQLAFTVRFINWFGSIDLLYNTGHSHAYSMALHEKAYPLNTINKHSINKIERRCVCSLVQQLWGEVEHYTYIY